MRGVSNKGLKSLVIRANKIPLYLSACQLYLKIRRDEQRG